MCLSVCDTDWPLRHIIKTLQAHKATGSLVVQTLHRGEMEEKENLKMLTLVQEMLVSSYGAVE